MKRNFFVAFSAALWLLMAVGFSDNWLFDIGQDSNRQWKFMVHAFFAASWFTLLVVQAVLVRSRNTRIHMKLGIVALLFYAAMTVTIWGLYVESALQRDDWTRLVKPLEVLSVVLVVLGFLNRKRDSQRHKEYMLFGSFCLVGPALDRSVFHVFGPEHMLIPMFAIYLLMAGAFVWYLRGFRWYLLVWLVAWGYSVHPIFLR